MKRKISNFLDKLEESILVFMFFLMVIVIFGQVIARYVFNDSLSWSEEFGKFLFVWLSWLGISIGAKRNEHIKITMFIDKLSDKKRIFCEILSEIIVFTISIITAYYGLELVESQANIHFAGIKISMAWGYLAVSVGCILMAIRNIINIKIDLDILRVGDLK